MTETLATTILIEKKKIHQKMRVKNNKNSECCRIRALFVLHPRARYYNSGTLCDFLGAFTVPRAISLTETVHLLN